MTSLVKKWKKMYKMINKGCINRSDVCLFGLSIQCVVVDQPLWPKRLVHFHPCARVVPPDRCPLRQKALLIKRKLVRVEEDSGAVRHQIGNPPAKRRGWCGEQHRVAKEASKAGLLVAIVQLQHECPVVCSAAGGGGGEHWWPQWRWWWCFIEQLLLVNLGLQLVHECLVIANEENAVWSSIVPRAIVALFHLLHHIGYGPMRKWRVRSEVEVEEVAAPRVHTKPMVRVVALWLRTVGWWWL